jgi:membrane protease YdiL (CAAX protease family)
MTNRKQLNVFFVLLALYALSAFVTYAFFVDQLAASAGVPVPDLGVPDSLLGLANAGIVLVLYGALGLAGYWFARKLDLPGIFSKDGNWRRWFFIPLVIGLICGVAVVLVDVLFAPINGYGRIVHPPFPISILASIGAGIGEEILFRGFVFGLWGFILNWLFKRFNGRTVALSRASTGTISWIANILGALAFAASHLGTKLSAAGSATWLDQGKPWAVFTAEDVVYNVDVSQYIRQKGP